MSTMIRFTLGFCLGVTLAYCWQSHLQRAGERRYLREARDTAATAWSNNA